MMDIVSSYLIALLSGVKVEKVVEVAEVYLLLVVSWWYG